MDRRRFFNQQSLNESFSPKQDRYTLEAVFEELNRLYEADEQPQENEDKAEAKAAPEAETTAEVTDKAVDEKEPAAEPEAIVDKLQNSDYEQFVSILNSDGKSKAFLQYLTKHYNLGDDEIGTVKKASPSVATIKCSALQPTQKNISVGKSLGMVSEPGWSESIINNPASAFKTPTVTYAGKYIIDGHHRWSKAYALNGDCTISALDFPAISGVTWEDMLKAVQLAIVATNPSAKLINEVGKDNMLGSNGPALAKKEYLENACDAVIAAMKAKGRGDTKEAQAATVEKNVGQMISTSQPVSGAKERAFMPQMDDRGNAQKKIEKRGIIDMTA